MKIQIISNTKNIKIEGYEVIYSTLNNPKTFDSYDVNIIDLQNENLWKNEGNSFTTIKYIADFKTLQPLIESNQKSNTIIALPQNYIFYKPSEKEYEDSFRLKNGIENLKSILSNILPKCLLKDSVYTYNLAFENSETKCGKSIFKSAFYFSQFPSKAEVTKANDSGKATTLKVTENCFITTLNLTDTDCKLKDLFDTLGIKDNEFNYPQWLIDLERFDDKSQNETITKSESEIVELQKVIKEAQDKLQSNLRFKSILTENGDALVEVVFNILEKILNCDLSSFKDEKKEDFLIKLENCTFIGEIKGINTNVKSENVSQVEVHYQSYLEKLDEETIEENVKALLIINSQRSKPIDERDEVHINQINLAKRNGSLIIPTISLLEIYEKFLNKKITTEDVIKIFTEQEGLIDLK